MTLLMRLIYLGYTLLQLVSAHESQDVKTAARGAQSELDLAARIQQPLVYQPDALNHALTIIHTLQQAPSCNRLAAATLIDSCRNIEAIDETASKNSNVALDQVRTTYAARLAVCELTGAHASVPPQCSAMAPRDRPAADWGLKCKFSSSGCATKGETARQNEPYYAKVGQKQRQQCLAALESKPQWWTSYSNARQNAVSICYASRSEVEIDDMLDTYRSMAGATSDMSQALDDTMRRSALFAQEVKRLQTGVTQELEIARANAQGSFGAFVQNLEARLATAFGFTKDRLQEFKHDVDDLGSKIQETSSDADAVREKLHTVMHDAEDHSQHQREELESQRELTIAVRSSQAAAQDAMMAHLTTAITDLQDGFRASMEHHYAEHNQWIQHFQKTYAEDQNKILDYLHARVSDTENSFGTMQDKLGTLATTIDEKTAQVSSLNLLGLHALGRWAKWIMMAVMAGLAHVMIDKTVTIYLAAACICWFAVAELGVFDGLQKIGTWLRATSDVLLAQQTLVMICLAVLLSVGITGGSLVWQQSKTRAFANKDVKK